MPKRKVKKMSNGDGSVTIDTKLNNKEFKNGINQLESIGKKGLKGLTVATSTTMAGLATLGGYAVKVGSDFESGMSKVQAISGATGEEIDKLTEKAKEMGAKTKFSASESAEAFQYMAMAGWKTEDMLNGIEGIMNLAAASGEELASVSDIVTDALTAFGLQAKDSAHFADVLAKASSNSNTNVGLMGETFKYVAPLAGSMKYSVEDTAIAIGLMANAGIKGSQAGTALRSMLTRLVKPPKEAAVALDKLNVSAKNSDGTMKPLSQTMQELRVKFAKLSESQKASYAASIAGQEAMSGMLAIVNASDDDFNKLTKAINNSEGATKEMADTMNNNLKGATTIMQSNMESLGLAIYEKFKGPATKGIKSVTEALEKLTKDTSNGKLSKSLDKIASSFGKLIEKGANLMSKVLPKLIDGLAWILDHGKTIAKVVGVITGAIVTFKTAAMINNVIDCWKKAVLQLNLFEIATMKMGITQGLANANLTLGQTAVSLLTGKISLATVAQKLWNMAMSANPIGLIITAVVGLTAAALGYCIAVEKEKVSLGGLRDEVENQKKSWEELGKTRNETLSNSMSEITHCESLVDELSKITDENGKVKDGYKERAQVILSELNNALGTEYKLNGNIIDSYKELRNNIQKVIDTKKAEAVLNAYQSEYGEAIKKETEATKTLVELKKKYAEASKKMVDGSVLERAEAKQQCESIAREIGKQMELIGNYGKVIMDYDNLQTATLEGNQEKIKIATENLTTSYEEVKQSASNSSAEQINSQAECVRYLKESLQEVATTSNMYQEKILNKQLKTQQEKLNNLIQGLINETKAIKELTPQQVDAWKNIAEQSYTEYSKVLAKLDPTIREKIEKATGIIASDTSLSDNAGKKANEVTTVFGTKLKISDTALNEINVAKGKMEYNKLLQEESKKTADEMTKRFEEKLKLGDKTKIELNNTANEINSNTTVQDEARRLAGRAQMAIKSNDSSKWGEDMVTGLGNGISRKSNSSWFTGILGGLAGKVASYIHFSRPDVGPLREYEKWMPDMINGLTKTLEGSSSKLYNASEKLAEKVKEGLDIDKTYEKMKATVDFETQKLSTNLSTKATLQLAKDQPKTVNNDNGVTINNTQQFYSKNATPYEEQKQAKQQLRRLAYGL